MKYRFEYLPYRRKFRRPLATAHGVWEHREGIIIRLEREDGAYGFGEVAPVPWFGTETMEAALKGCEFFSGLGIVDPRDLPTNNMPCFNWAVSSAIDGQQQPLAREFTVAALETNLGELDEKRHSGFRTFKRKIGVAEVEAEMKAVDSFVAELEEGQRLRLDANSGLSEHDFKRWLEFLEGKPVEFLEQPLAPGLENRMLEIVEPFSTPLALDESIAGLDSLLRWRDWPGVLVVKPSLLGWIGDENLPPIVGSSVFETAFGFEAALQFLSRHQKTDTAIGFGTNDLFESDGWSLHGNGAFLTSGKITNSDLQNLWEEKRENIS